MASITFSPVGVEALDDPAADPALVRRMLADIARCNSWLGGAAAARFGIAQLLQPSDRGRTLTLFDIGTGAGDLPRNAQRWAARRGVSLVPLALERIPAAAVMAHDSGVPVAVGCLGALPLRARSVDIVLVSQVAHHLDHDSLLRLVADCSIVARRGVVLADLHPRWFAAPGLRIAGALLRMHRTSIGDGVISLRRGYTPEQLRALCIAGGAARASAAARPGARVVAWWRTDDA